jgi:hypothetical protein
MQHAETLLRMADAAGRIEGRVEALGSLYAFLVRALDGQQDAARAEFRRYLKGEMSPELLRLARRQIDQS